MLLMQSSRVLLIAWAGVLMLAVPSTRMEGAPKDEAPPAPKIIDSTGADPKTLQAEGWHTSKPPYPYKARATHEQGRLSVVITTGADGRVVKATVLSSVPHPVLDVSSAKWAYAQWYGPPYHRLKVPVNYVLQ